MRPKKFARQVTPCDRLRSPGRGAAGVGTCLRTRGRLNGDGRVRGRPGRRRDGLLLTLPRFQGYSILAISSTVFVRNRFVVLVTRPVGWMPCTGRARRGYRSRKAVASPGPLKCAGSPHPTSTAAGKSRRTRLSRRGDRGPRSSRRSARCAKSPPDRTSSHLSQARRRVKSSAPSRSNECSEAEAARARRPKRRRQLQAWGSHHGVRFCTGRTNLTLTRFLHTSHATTTTCAVISVAAPVTSLAATNATGARANTTTAAAATATNTNH